MNDSAENKQLLLLLTEVAKKIKDEPDADSKKLVSHLKTVLDENSQLASAANLMIQINQKDARGFQTLVTGGTAYIGNHYHVDEETLQTVLEIFIAEQKPKSIGTPQNIPLSGVPDFVGRETDLEELHKKLQQKATQPTIAAIAGMGGLGKSELAIQYARTYLDTYVGGACWIFTGDFEVAPQIVKFAESQLGLKIPEGLELMEQLSFCWRHWQEGDVLLILDDVTDFPKLKPYLPMDTRFKVLLTTRLQLGAPVRLLTLKVLTKESSLQLLESDFLVGKERVTAEKVIADRMCDWLGYLPLGLELVGRYLNQESNLSLSTMLFNLQSQALKEESLVRDPNDPTWSMTAQRGVAAAFELSWKKLQEDSRRLGRILSLFALSPIPWRLVVSTEQHRCDLFPENGEFSPKNLSGSRKELIRFHLLQRLEQETYLLHALIRKFFQQKLEELDSAID